MCLIRVVFFPSRASRAHQKRTDCRDRGTGVVASTGTGNREGKPFVQRRTEYHTIFISMETRSKSRRLGRTQCPQRTQCPSTTLCNLSVDVLHTVASHLGMRSLVALATTSRLFNLALEPQMRPTNNLFRKMSTTASAMQRVTMLNQQVWCHHD